MHDVTDAETLLRRIDEYRSEMDAREEGFNKVMEGGEKMIDNGHFAADEVRFLKPVTSPTSNLAHNKIAYSQVNFPTHYIIKVNLQHTMHCDV